MQNYGIDRLSKFDIKSKAGNIIPAIATTNAIIAGLMVGAVDLCICVCRALMKCDAATGNGAAEGVAARLGQLALHLPVPRPQPDGRVSAGANIWVCMCHIGLIGRAAHTTGSAESSVRHLRLRQPLCDCRTQCVQHHTRRLCRACVEEGTYAAVWRGRDAERETERDGYSFLTHRSCCRWSVQL